MDLLAETSSSDSLQNNRCEGRKEGRKGVGEGSGRIPTGAS